MKLEIEEWYASKHLPIDRVIDIGMKRQGIKRKEALLAALEEEYDVRTKPSAIPMKDISIAWNVWHRARRIQSENRTSEAIERYNEDQARIKDLTLLLEDKNREYAELELNFNAKVNEAKDEYGKIKDARFKKIQWSLHIAYILLILAGVGYHLWKMGVF